MYAEAYDLRARLVCLELYRHEVRNGAYIHSVVHQGFFSHCKNLWVFIAEFYYHNKTVHWVSKLQLLSMLAKHRQCFIQSVHVYFKYTGMP